MGNFVNFLKSTKFETKQFPCVVLTTVNYCLIYRVINARLVPSFSFHIFAVFIYQGTFFFFKNNDL